jgi:hypothetical protein
VLHELDGKYIQVREEFNKKNVLFHIFIFWSNVVSKRRCLVEMNLFDFSFDDGATTPHTKKT